MEQCCSNTFNNCKQMIRNFFFLIILMFLSLSAFSQYVMSNLTVYDCEGTLTDSESNTLNPGWYSSNENYEFTICPSGAQTITITFSMFRTEVTYDYLMIHDGPNSTYPVIGGPYSGLNIPPQINSNGCVTITFVSDQNVNEEGFVLSWETEISVPPPPIITIPNAVTCSSNVLLFNLDKKMHCDSVYTALINITGQISQQVSASPINCINDSTDQIELTLFPGLNQSGIYDLSLQSFFLDACDSIWDLSTDIQFVINDCPLQVDIVSTPDSVICEGECVDLFVNVSGGDVSSYNFTWNPPLPNSPGPHNVCPTISTLYSVLVSDAGPAASQTDNILISVLPPPVTQSSFDICQTGSPINLNANPVGGIWSGNGIVDPNGIFSPYGLPPGTYTVDYQIGGCEDDLDITILEVNAGDDISVCVNTPVFNLSSSFTTPGGVWSGCSCIQSNGNINVGSNPTIITAIYTLPNGCSDTLLVNVVNNILMPQSTSFCQRSGNHSLSVFPSNGVWSVLPQNSQASSICVNPIDEFPYQEGWELGLNGWTHDVNNDFDWQIISGPTPSGNTGPNSSLQGNNYIYTEASNNNSPSKTAALISPCINLSEYDNPVLYFWYHKYGNGQGSFSIDVSSDNGNTWTWNHWSIFGDMGDQWNEISVDLSSFNTSEVLIRLRVVTGDNYRSDVAVDQLSILGGPISPSGIFLTEVASAGIHNLVYSIEGCSDFVDITVNEINAGIDETFCPQQSQFNLNGSPVGGIWSGNGIVNANGVFDPSIAQIGYNNLIYSYSGCTDTVEFLVVDTDIQLDSLVFCLNSGLQILNMNIVPRTPWDGVWSGQGIVNSTFPGEFNPNLAGVGVHNIQYSANTCADNIIINVLPQSVLLDTLICSTSSDLILDIFPSGGTWDGNGIINSSTGLFSPSQLGVGIHYVRYTSSSNCVDTFLINIYEPPILEINGLDDVYCSVDTNIIVLTSPLLGGVLSGPGINGNIFNPSLANTGYNTIKYTYGSGNCSQIIEKQVFVNEKINGYSYYSNDSICTNDIAVIGINVNGGLGNFSFTWDNGLSTSFEHLVSPIVSTDYIVNVSDGCSDNFIDTISIYVHPTFSLSFTTSQKKCFGDLGYAKVDISPQGNYTYSWNSNPESFSDSISQLVNRNYKLVVTDLNTNCQLEDTVTIPGYSNLKAYFSPNTTECVSLLNGEIQFINNCITKENEIYYTSFWDFGDGNTTNYIDQQSPVHTYLDTGIFEVKLYLENIGGCTDSISQTICVNPDYKLYIPNSFTPNGDNCNDKFFVKAIGSVYSFNINIYKRWGSEPIFNSKDIIYTNNMEDGNMCNTNLNQDSYFMMGVWDGNMNNGKQAKTGVYPFLMTYQMGEKSVVQEMIGYILLIR